MIDPFYAHHSDFPSRFSDSFLAHFYQYPFPLCPNCPSCTPFNSKPDPSTGSPTGIHFAFHRSCTSLIIILFYSHCSIASRIPAEFLIGVVVISTLRLYLSIIIGGFDFTALLFFIFNCHVFFACKSVSHAYMRLYVRVIDCPVNVNSGQFF
jgi:hypothetical protein